MNPLTNVKNITKLSELELNRGTSGKATWHDMYKDSAWIFIGGLPYDLTEGDVLTVFSQFGEIANINLVRDKKTGKTKGFCFLCYVNQKSTVLAVDNLNGIKLLNRTIRVDHVQNYKPPKERDDDDELTKKLYAEGCAPAPIKIEDHGVSVDEKPSKKVKKEKKNKKEKKKRKKRKKHSSSSSTQSSSESDSENVKVKKNVDTGSFNRESFDSGSDSETRVQKRIYYSANAQNIKTEKNSNVKQDSDVHYKQRHTNDNRSDNVRKEKYNFETHSKDDFQNVGKSKHHSADSSQRHKELKKDRSSTHKKHSSENEDYSTKRQKYDTNEDSRREASVKGIGYDRHNKDLKYEERQRLRNEKHSDNSRRRETDSNQDTHRKDTHGYSDYNSRTHSSSSSSRHKER